MLAISWRLKRGEKHRGIGRISHSLCCGLFSCCRWLLAALNRWLFGGVVIILLVGCTGDGHFSTFFPSEWYRTSTQQDSNYPDLNSVPLKLREVPILTSLPDSLPVQDNTRQDNSLLTQPDSIVLERARELRQRHVPPKQEIIEPEWSIDE